jgi:hypothetical protein
MEYQGKKSGTWVVGRRRFPRYRTALPLRVRDHLERQLEGYCDIIAEGGLGVTLSETLPPGSVVLLQFALPNRPTELQVWAIVRSYVDPHQHGLEFISLNDEERLSIRLFCNELAVQSVSGEQTDPR